MGELYVKLNLDSRAFTTQINKIKADLGKLASKPINIKIQTGKIDTSSIKAAKQEIVSIGSNATQLGGQFSSLGSIINNAFSFAIGSVLAQGIMQIGQALASIVPTAASFESQMSAISAVLSPTGQEFDALREKALQLGKDTKFSASESASAIEELGKQGLSIDQILGGAVDATVALAAATGTDLTTSATVASDVLNSFGLSADQLTNAVNGVTGVLNASKFDINDYQLALANGGAAVAGFGVELSDFNAVIAATANQFKSGQSAGTAFRVFINRLTPNTDTATQAMRELGIITADGTNRFYDAAGNLKSMAEVAEIAKQSFGGLTEAQASAYAEVIFGSEAIGTVIGLMQQGADGVNRYAEAIAKTDAASQAATRMDNFSGAVEQLNGSLETFGIVVGDQVLPFLTGIVQGLTETTNIATSVAEAIFGSAEAFNSLPAPLQTVVAMVQNVIEYFSGLADLAAGWGQNIGSQFADGIISAANDVIDALMEMGSWVEYWLAPGSPPRIAPDLDKWGMESAQVYWDSWAKGDFSSLSKMGDIVQTVLGDLVDSGSFEQKDVIPTLLGTQDAFAKAIQQIRETGDISREAFQNVIESAGPAGEEIQRLINLYMSMERVSKRVKDAEQALANAQSHLNSILEEYNTALSPINDQLDAIAREQKKLDIASELEEQMKIANSFGGSEEERAKARLRIQELLLEQQKLAIEEQYAGTIKNAEEDVKAKEEELAKAEEQQKQVQEQFELEQQKLAATHEQNALIQQQIDLMKKLAEEQAKVAEDEKSRGGGGGGSRASEIDKDKEAQDRYNFSIATTEEQLRILQDRQSKVTEGSAEWYQIQTQIDSTEKKLANERDKAAKELEEQQQSKLDAERDYRFSIADTAGKLAILRDELSKTEVGSEEYYKIATQIAQLEKQEKGGSGGGAGGGSSATIQRQEFEERQRLREEELKKRQELAQREMYEQQRLDAERKRNEQEQETAGRDTMTRIQGQLSAFMATVQSTINAFMSPIIAAWDSIWNSIYGSIVVITTNIRSIISGFLTIISELWQENGTQISEQVSTVWNQLVTIVSTTLGGIMQFIGTGLSQMALFFNTHHEQIKTIVMTVWNTIITTISSILTAIQGIINVIMGAINGNWSQVWLGIQQLVIGIFNALSNFIGGILNLIANLFGTSLTDIWNLWSSNLNKIWTFLVTTINNMLTSLSTWWSNVKIGWNTLITDITTAWSTFWTSISTAATNTTNTIKQTLDTWSGNIKTAWDTFVSGIKSAWENNINTLPGTIQTALDNAKNTVTGLVEDFKSAATSLGSSIIDGIKNGIEDGISGLADAARSAAESAISAAKRALKIESPSKVFYDIGQNVTLGMEQGIAQGIPDVAGTSTSMAAATIPTTMPSQKTGDTYIYEIDARGSDISEERFKQMIREVNNETASRGNKRSRFN